jgi:hypothetical protein
MHARNVSEAQATARALPDQRRNANVDSLKRYFAWRVRGRKDSTIFRSLLTLAGDSGATAASRVFGLLGVRDMFEPHHPVSFAIVATPPRSDGSMPCDHEDASDADTTTYGDPLPANATAQWRDLLARLERDPGTPVLVRHAAACVGFY